MARIFTSSNITKQYTRGANTLVESKYVEMPTLFHEYIPVPVPASLSIARIPSKQTRQPYRNISIPQQGPFLVESGGSFSEVEEKDKEKMAARLGKGGFGSVYLVRNKIDDNLYAIKEFVGGPNNEHILEIGHAEADILREIHTSLNSNYEEEQWTKDHILIPIEAYYVGDTGNFAQVTNYINGITLRERLKNKEEPLLINQKLTIVGDLLRIIDNLHKKGFVHRDIKPDNIMLCQDSKESKKQKVVLIDFGFACNKKDDVRVMAGTINFQAPELFSIGNFNIGIRKKINWKKTDVWACAATIYSIMHDNPDAPFPVPRLSKDMLNLPKDQQRAVQKQCMINAIDLKNHRANTGNDLANRYLDSILIDAVNPKFRSPISSMRNCWDIVCNSFFPSTPVHKVRPLSRLEMNLDPSQTLCIAALNPDTFYKNEGRVFLCIEKTGANACPKSHTFKSVRSIGKWLYEKNHHDPLCKKCSKKNL